MDSMYEINRRRRSRSRTRAREENTFKSIPNLNLGSEFTGGGYSLAGPEADPGRMYRSLGYIPDTDPAEENVWTPQEQRQYEVSWQRKSSKKRLNKLRLAVKFVTFSAECYELIVITLDAEDKKREIESCGANLLTISKVKQRRGGNPLQLQSTDTQMCCVIHWSLFTRISFNNTVKVFCY